MSKLKSGVYFVKFKDIDKFFNDAKMSGWKEGFEYTQEEIHHALSINGREDKTIKQLVIPFALNQEKSSAGYWITAVCFESDVEENMRIWSNWHESDKYIEFYQDKKLVL